MTKNVMDLMYRISTDTSLADTPIVKLYEEAVLYTTDDLNELFKLLEKLSVYTYEDYEFLVVTAQELSTTRKTVHDLLKGMCEAVGENIMTVVQQHPQVIDRYRYCPVRTEKVFVSVSPDAGYAKYELNRTDYSRMNLDEAKLDKCDWYTIYCFGLVE